MHDLRREVNVNFVHRDSVIDVELGRLLPSADFNVARP